VSPGQFHREVSPKFTRASGLGLSKLDSLKPSEISSFYGGGYENYSFLGYSVV
jgi:hypothetical protein